MLKAFGPIIACIIAFLVIALLVFAQAQIDYCAGVWDDAGYYVHRADRVPRCK